MSAHHQQHQYGYESDDEVTHQEKKACKPWMVAGLAVLAVGGLAAAIGIPVALSGCCSDEKSPKSPGGKGDQNLPNNKEKSDNLSKVPTLDTVKQLPQLIKNNKTQTGRSTQSDDNAIYYNGNSHHQSNRGSILNSSYRKAYSSAGEIRHRQQQPLLNLKPSVDFTERFSTMNDTLKKKMDMITNKTMTDMILDRFPNDVHLGRFLSELDNCLGDRNCLEQFAELHLHKVQTVLAAYQVDKATFEKQKMESQSLAKIAWGYFGIHVGKKTQNYKLVDYLKNADATVLAAEPNANPHDQKSEKKSPTKPQRVTIENDNRPLKPLNKSVTIVMDQTFSKKTTGRLSQGKGSSPKKDSSSNKSAEFNKMSDAEWDDISERMLNRLVEFSETYKFENIKVLKHMATRGALRNFLSNTRLREKYTKGDLELRFNDFAEKYAKNEGKGFTRTWQDAMRPKPIENN